MSVPLEGVGDKGEPKGSTRAEYSALRERAARLATANQRFAERTRDAQRGERNKGSASPYPRQTNVWRGRLNWRGLGGTRLREGVSPTRAEDSALRSAGPYSPR